MPLPPPGTRNLPGSSGKSGACFVCRTRKRFCCDFRAEAELVSFSARRAFSGPGGRRPSAQGVFCEGNFPPRVAPNGRACPPFAGGGAFPRLPGRTRNKPLSGPGRNARCAFPIERGRTVCPRGHTLAALLPRFARRRGISRRKIRPSALRRTPAKAVP